jgi:hypothetical protein
LGENSPKRGKEISEKRSMIERKRKDVKFAEITISHHTTSLPTQQPLTSDSKIFHKKKNSEPKLPPTFSTKTTGSITNPNPNTNHKPLKKHKQSKPYHPLRATYLT